MYRPTSTQSSLFEPDVMFPGVLPKDDWSYISRDKIYPLIDDSVDGSPYKAMQVREYCP